MSREAIIGLAAVVVAIAVAAIVFGLVVPWAKSTERRPHMLNIYYGFAERVTAHAFILRGKRRTRL